MAAKIAAYSATACPCSEPKEWTGELSFVTIEFTGSTWGRNAGGMGPELAAALQSQISEPAGIVHDFHRRVYGTEVVCKVL